MSLPNAVYVLVIQLNNDTNINVGALGKIAFEKGLYAYVGSAQKNLEQRIRRHLRKEKRLFWHIDYLLGSDAAEIVKVFYKKGEKSEECKTASEIDGLGKCVDGFGCSDCNCKSHLLHVEDKKLNRILQKMEELLFGKLNSP